MSAGQSILEAALAQYRTRSSWNDRLVHWERPASESEEAKIQRAANVATQIVASNAVLAREAITVQPQGSYYNNTNVRLEADMDLRVQLPGIVVECASDVDLDRAYQSEGYSDTGRTLLDVANTVRDELYSVCRRRFGANKVKAGNKAMTVEGLSGSRADVDLVPAFKLHLILNDGLGGYRNVKGVAIIGTDSSKTFNFPEQHHTNGKAKRERTQHRFKKIVRQLKRLNNELVELMLIPKRVPSFLIECLVHEVEDIYFGYDEDRYDRIRRICRRIQERLQHADASTKMLEINGVKYLFHPAQAWTLDQAQAFIAAALARLEA